MKEKQLPVTGQKQATEAEEQAQRQAETEIERNGAPPEQGESATKIADDDKTVLLLNTGIAEETPHIISPPASPSTPAERAQVHVAPNLLQVATGQVESAEEKHAAKERHDLDEMVHALLTVGLVASTTLMLIGLVEDIVLRSAMPTVEPAFGQVIPNVVALRPSGFLALGLVVLLATPILRVVGSVAAFAYERDWRFTGITLVVLMIVVTSILLGKG